MIWAPIHRPCWRDLAEFTHLVTRIKVVPAAADDASLTPDERDAWRRSGAAPADAGADPGLADPVQGQ